MEYFFFASLNNKTKNSSMNRLSVLLQLYSNIGLRNYETANKLYNVCVN